jgi:hypothetical protein
MTAKDPHPNALGSGQGPSPNPPGSALQPHPKSFGVLTGKDPNPLGRDMDPAPYPLGSALQPQPNPFGLRTGKCPHPNPFGLDPKLNPLGSGVRTLPKTPLGPDTEGPKTKLPWIRITTPPQPNLIGVQTRKDPSRTPLCPKPYPKPNLYGACTALPSREADPSTTWICFRL